MSATLRTCLLAAALCLIPALPSFASEPPAPTIGQQREAVLFWPQAQREARETSEELNRGYRAQRMGLHYLWPRHQRIFSILPGAPSSAPSC